MSNHPALPARVTRAQLARFLASADAHATEHGEQFAREQRVEPPAAQDHGVTMLVRGETGKYQVSFWIEAGQLASACDCPSWRDPCKHQVAAARALWLPPRDSPAADRATDRAVRPRPPRQATLASVVADRPPDAEAARRDAMEERQVAARRERMRTVPADEPAHILVHSHTGFTYTVAVRGDVDGPHGCDCPDFEANRLHACKHVERVRLTLAAGGMTLPAAHVEAARRPRVYLHFGEAVEPRWFGPAMIAAADGPLAACFDAVGRWTGPLGDVAAMREALLALGDAVEPAALAWLEDRLRRVPDFDGVDPATLIPATPLPLHGYQRAGIAFLARTGRALLADEMGLGKTVQAILAAVVMRRARAPVHAVTIVCPASLRGGWQDEIRRWAGEDATLLRGSASEREATIASRPAWLVTHYEQVLRDHAVHHAHAPDLVILDEAQRAKGLRAVTARALKDIPARHVFALTGTPLENRLEEAYAIAQLIDQRLLPPLWQLERDHQVRDEDGRRVIAYRGLDALRTRLQPAFLRRRKEDVALDLPARIRSLMLVPMHAQALPSYDEALAAVRRIAAKKKLLPADLDRLQRLLMIARRACDGPHLVGVKTDPRNVPKLAELRQLLRDACLGERRKAVVFSEWTEMTASAEDVARRLGLPVFSLRGDVAVPVRPQLLRAFASQDGPAVFVSTDAGGLGLNLQAADLVINLDLPWNPARLEQRLARVHRIGAVRTVQEILLVTENSLEERMLAVHATKQDVLANVWARDGETVVAAPGSAESFRAAVGRLLDGSPDVEPGLAPAAEAAARSRDGHPPDPVADVRVQAIEELARAVRESASHLSRAEAARAAALLRELADSLEG